MSQPTSASVFLVALPLTVLIVGGVAALSEAASPPPAAIDTTSQTKAVRLQVLPRVIALSAGNRRQTLIVTAEDRTGRLRDVSRHVGAPVADRGVAAVTGLVGYWLDSWRR